MVTKLKNMKLTSVDLVRAGANQEADIGLFKSAGPQAEYDEALVKSARSILEDPDLTEDQRAGMLAKSVDDYRAALEEPEDEPEEPDGEEVMVEKEPEEKEPEDLDEIEEVEKYNHNHAADGKFTFSGGGSSGGGGGSHGSKVQWHTQGHDWWPDKTKRPSKKPEGRIEYHLAPKKPKDSGRRKDPWNDMKFNVPTPRPGAHDGSTGPRWDPKEDEQMVFLPGGGKTKKSSFTSGDRYDTIETVQKFNPFHDALGRFASSNSFRTYSANPKSKAGAMAIDRSAQAGHTYTLNVHAESKGENIGQNYDWLHHTTQAPQAPFSAMIGNTGQPKKNPKPKKPKTEPEQPKMETAAKPESKANESIAEAVKDVSLSSSQKLALQARDTNGHACDTKKVADDYEGVRVEGKDISGSFDYQTTDTAKGLKSGNGVEEFSAIDEVAKAQGWDKGRPTVISDRETFDKLCLQNGCVLVRSVHDNPEASAADVANITMTRNDTSLGAGEGTAYGGGLYMVNTSIDPTKSAKGMAHAVAAGQAESYWYGPTQMMATLRPGAKIADYATTTRLETEFNDLPWSEKGRFGNDVGAYIASKGYDGAKWHDDSNPGAYSTIYNKSALVFFNEVAENH